MSRCRARRENDQLVCRQCGLAWDVNDPDPPACREPPSKREQNRQRALRHLDAIIQELERDCGK